MAGIIYIEDTNNDGVHNDVEIGADNLITSILDLTGTGAAAGDVVLIGPFTFFITATDITNTFIEITFGGTINDGTFSSPLTINQGSAAGPVIYTDTFSITGDSTAPTFVGNVVSDMQITEADSGSWTYTVFFSEEMDPAFAPNITTNAATTLIPDSGAWQPGNTSYVMTFTLADDDVELSDVTVSIDGARDLAGNPMNPIVNGSIGVSIDTDAPASTGLINVTTLLITEANAGGTFELFINFDEVMDPSVDPTVTTNFGSTLIAGVGNWQPGNTSYRVVYTVVDADVEISSLILNVNGAQDLAGNTMTPIVNSTFPTVKVDTLAPTIVSATLGDASITEGDVAGTVDLVITFDQMMDSTYLPTVTTNAGSTLTLPSGAWSAGDTVYTVTYTIADADVELADITVNISDARELSGNLVTPVVAQLLSASVDTAAPAVSSAVLSDTAINESDDGATVTLTITFDETMDITYTPTIATNAGSTLTLPSGVWSAGDTVYTVTYTVADADVELAGITVDISDARDVAGNVMTAIAGQSLSASVDTIAPAAPSIALDDDTGISNTDSVTGNPQVNVSGLEAVGTWEYSIDNGGTWTPGVGNTFDLPEGVSLVSVRQTDAAGNVSASSAPVAFNVDLTPPDPLATTSETIDEYAEPTDGIAPGYVLASFSNDDAGPLGLTYSFAPGSNLDGAFALVISGGFPPMTELQVADPNLFDYEDNVSLSVDIVTTDGAGNEITTTFTVNLDDVNDAPEVVVGSSTISGTIAERVDLAPNENDPAGFELAGTVVFTDDETADTHSVSIAQGTSTAPGGTFLGLFQAGLNQDVGGGTVDWTFDDMSVADMAVVDALAVGETIVQTYDVTVIDRLGQPDSLSTTQQITITITGTNDAPTIAAAVDTGEITEGDVSLNQVGTIDFEDVDLSDMPSVTSVLVPSIEWIDADGTTVLFLTGIQMFDLASGFTTSPAAGNSNNGTIDWDYTIAESTLDFLGADETVTIAYDVAIGDGNGGSVTQLVTITINGTNDAPVITAGDVAGDITEGATLIDTGSITFADVDLTDAPDAMQTTSSVTAIGQLGGPLVLTTTQQDAIETAFSITPDGGNTNNGLVTWDYNIAEADLDFLGEGEVVTAVFTITVTDDEGETDTQDVTITINGTNDAPVISFPTLFVAPTTETTMNGDFDVFYGPADLVTDVDISDSVTVEITSVDVTADTDAGDTGVPLDAQFLAIAGIAGSETNNGPTEIIADGDTTGNFDLQTNATGTGLFDFLSAGETLLVRYNYEVSDSESVTDTGFLEYNIIGENDAVTLDAGGDVEGAVTEVTEGGIDPEGTTVLSDMGSFGFSDLDIDDTHSVTIADGPGVGPGGSVLGTLTAVVSETEPGDGGGSVDWTFTIDDADVEYLSDGEQVTQTFIISLSDDSMHDGAGNLSTVMQTVSITITGTNDLPIVAVNDPVAGTEGDSVDTTIPPTPTAPGPVTIDLLNDTDDGSPTGNPITDITEIDLSDVLSIDTVSLSNTTLSTTMDAIGVPMDPASIEALFDVSADDGTIVYDRNALLFDRLDDGESITVEVTYDVVSTRPDTTEDRTTHTITLTITGENDAPYFTSAATSLAGDITEFADGSIVVGEVENVDTHEFVGTITYDDVELDDTHIITVDEVTGPDTPADTADYLGSLSAGFPATATGPGEGQIIWTYTVADSLLDALGAGEVITQRYQVFISDGDASVMEDIVVTITGTNDAPVITGTAFDSGINALAEDNFVVESGSTDTQSLTGTIDFDDVDTNDVAAAAGNADTHSISATFNSALSTAGYTGPEGTFTFDASAANLSNAVGNTATWEYEITDGDFDFLADGEVLSLVYDVVVTDSSGTTNADSAATQITITIVGTNDLPVISSGPDTSSLQEDVLVNVLDELFDSGTLNFSDIDLLDSHTASAAFTSSSSTSAPFNGGGQLGNLTASATTQTDASGNNGVVTWFYAVDNIAVQGLGEGQTIEEIYTITVDDGLGGLDTQTVTVTVTGTNDAPVISTAPVMAAVEEDVSVVADDPTTMVIESGAYLSDTGTLDFSDVDLTDSHTASAAFTSSTSTSAGVVADTQFGNLVASVSTQTDGTGANGEISWTYAVDNTAVQFLAEGETVTEVYTVTVDDAATGGTTTQTVTVVITGDNDAVEISSGPDTGAVEEDTAVDAGNLVDTGTLAFDDVDFTDSHTASAAFTSSTNTSAAVAPNAQFGTLTASVSTQTDAMGQNGVVTWDYSVNNAAVQFLAEGETVTEVYTVTVDDGNGGMDMQTVSVTITGDNDAPVISTAAVISSVEEDTGVVADDPTTMVVETGEFLSDTGTLDFSDVDLTDGHTASAAFTTSSSTSAGVAANTQFGNLIANVSAQTNGTGANGEITWTYAVDNTAVQFLAEGETITEVYTVTVDDSETGGTTMQTVTVTITGDNDVPTVTANVAETFTEDDANPATVDLLEFVDDIDVNDDHDTSGVTVTLDAGSSNVAWAPAFVFSVDDETGALTFDPNQFDGLDDGEQLVFDVDYDITDGTDSITVSGTITIDGVNDAPVANDDTTEVNEGAFRLINPMLGTTGGMVADTDVDGDTLTLVSGADIDDGFGDFSSGSANVTVSVAGTFFTDFGAEVTMESDGSITYNLTSPSALFNTLRDGETAVDTLTYTVSDGDLTDTATVSVTITGTNDPITAVADSIAATENDIDDGMDDGDISGDLVANDTDVDIGDTKTVTGVVAGPGVTSVTPTVDGFDVGLGLGVIIRVNSSGTYDVIIPESLTVNDQLVGSFNYTVQDGSGDTSIATVDFTIDGLNDAPEVAGPLSSDTDEGDAAFTVDLLDGATDVDTGETATLDIQNVMYAVDGGLPSTTLPAGISLAGADLGVDPTNAAYDGLAIGDTVEIVVSYEVVDENAATVAQTATVTISGTNDAPTVAAALTAAADEDDAGFTIDMLTGASDVDNGAVLSVANVTGLVAGITFAGSTISVDPTDASFQSLDQDEDLVVVVSYDVVDGLGGSVPQTATITITGTNDAPTVAAALTADADEDDDGFTVDMLAGASDIDDGAVLSVTNVAGLVDGVTFAGTTLTVDPTDASFQSLAVGDDVVIVVTYDVEDEFLATVAQTATITISGTNDAPVADVDIADAVEDGAPIMGSVATNDSDVDDDAVLEYTLDAPVTGLTFNSDGSYSYDPNADSAFQALGAGETLDVVVNYTVTDENEAAAGSTLTIRVTGVNDTAVVSGDFTGDVVEDNIFSASGAIVVTDTDAGENGVQAIASGTASDGGFGTIEVLSDGNWTYSLDNANPAVQGLAVGATMMDTFTVLTFDGAEQSITITITGGINSVLGTNAGDLLEGQFDEDIIIGFDGDDMLFGGSGNDSISGGLGADILDGGDGFDTLDYSTSDARVIVDLSANSASGGHAQGDMISGFENVSGSGFNDILTGSAGVNVLFGDAGNDILDGGDHVDLTASESQIYRLYLAALAREPDVDGLNFWTGLLDSGAKTLQEIADIFEGTAGFQLVYGGLDNTDFMTLLYQNVLERAPDAGGLAAWLSFLDNGGTRAQVVKSFSEAEGHKNLTDLDGIAFAQSDIYDAHLGEVFRLYDAALDRAPDKAGFEFWLSKLDEGTHVLADIAEIFVGTAGFQLVYGGLNNTDFMTLLYQNALDRAPDAGGLAAWVSFLDNGGTRAQVVEAFSEAQGHRDLTDAALIDFITDVQADWTNTLDGGLGNDQLVGGRGRDIFVFDANENGSDTVFGLQSWDDVQLDSFGYTDAAEALTHFSQSGDDTVFTDQGVTITFVQTLLTDITEDMIVVTLAAEAPPASKATVFEPTVAEIIAVPVMEDLSHTAVLQQDLIAEFMMGNAEQALMTFTNDQGVLEIMTDDDIGFNWDLLVG